LEKDKCTHESYDFSKCDYYELTAIEIKHITANSYDKWLNQYLMEYNMIIEIWETALLIKAGQVIIDGRAFLIP